MILETGPFDLSTTSFTTGTSTNLCYNLSQVLTAQVELSPPKMPAGSNLAWLDGRINEMRVKL